MKRTALISVSDKSGIADFARHLTELDFQLLSTGGTARTLQEAGIDVQPVSDRTGFPEILGGRVKTLHPRIHGGILADHDKTDHLRQLDELDISPIQLVCVNLYPFRETVAGGAAEPDVIENIDIGGPSMVRASAKNFRHVIILVDPADYPEVLRQLKKHGNVDMDTRRNLARKAFAHTASYDIAISDYFNRQMDIPFPEKQFLELNLRQELRYGENPHQPAAFYSEPDASPDTLPHLDQLQGKALSYNNIMDTDAAINMVREFEDPAAVIVKHANPCGIGRDSIDLATAFERAHSTDPLSAFGGIIALNRKVDLALAEEIAQHFVEVIVAPDFDEDAKARFARKKNLRILKLPVNPEARSYADYRRIRGGMLLQAADTITENSENWEIVTDCKPSPETMRAMAFAWKVVKHVKSNAIVFCRENETVGIGAGQMSRVDSVKLAVTKANKPIAGTVLASDAFFPFRDSIDEASGYKVSAIVQPGGSVRDEEVIDAANEHGIPMIFTRIRHFRH